MGTLVSIILIAVAFLSVAAVLYFVVTEKVEHEEDVEHTTKLEPTANSSSDEAGA